MPEKTKPKHLSGVKKGGKRFPQLGLAKAIEYCAKLVSKTHSGSLPQAEILAGVFSNSGSTGQVRLSALKQYGLLDGLSSGYTASPLAKQIIAAPKEERQILLVKAFFSAKVFKVLFDTFNGDTVSAAKIRQKAIIDGVHPDTADKCVAFFIEGIISSELGTASGDGVLIKPVSQVGPTATNSSESQDSSDLDNLQENPRDIEQNKNQQGVESADFLQTVDVNSKSMAQTLTAKGQAIPIHIDLKLDSSMDADKLEKMMLVLRKYGAV